MSNNVIYADNAATTPLSPKALEAMLPFLQNQYGNASQPYSFSRSVRKALMVSRERIADCIGASPNEIYFTSGGSEGNNWIINGATQFQTKIVTSPIEHHSILRAVEYSKSIGIDVSYLPTSSTGMVENDTLAGQLSQPLSLVSVMFVNNEIGSIQKISELSRVTHERGCLFHTDAVQCVGHLELDVKALDIDMLTASAHKFNGPKGIGFVYIKKGIKWPNLIYGGSQEFGLRAGTENIASIVGMAEALVENVLNIGENIRHCRNLESILINRLDSSGISYVRNGDMSHLPGIISLSFDGFEGEMLLHRLDLMGVMVSTGSACDSKELQISHVLKAIKMDETLAKGTIRISLGRLNTVEEAIRIADVLSKMVKPQPQASESVQAYYSREEKIEKALKDRYYKEFNNFNVSKMYRSAAPHKPVYMLTLIEAIRRGIISDHRFQFTQELTDLFNQIWSKLVSPSSRYTPRITRPAFYLTTSSFYRIKPWEGNIAKEWHSPKSFAANYEYIEIDNTLFKLLRDDEAFVINSKEIFLHILQRI